MFIWIWKKKNFILKWYYSKKREKYDRELSSSKYIKWQLQVMKAIYMHLIQELNEEGIDINLTSLDISGKKQEYEAVTIKVKEQSYPFNGVCNKDKLTIREDISKPVYTYDDLSNKAQKMVKRYYRMIKYSIRYPDRLGYMLDEIIVSKEDGAASVSAYSGCYRDNIVQSHILKYELFELYKKKHIRNCNDILEKLEIRNKLHTEFKIHDSAESRILLSGKYRSSLLGVQIMVFVKNVNGSFDALRIRRSTDVAAKAGYLQFIPSGGFEAIGDGKDFDSQWDNYSIPKSLFRELLEECFGMDEDDKKFSSNTKSPDRLCFNAHIQEILKMIQREPQHARFEFLGSTMSLVGLRHELSFILVIDKPDFASQLIGNYESKAAIHLVDILRLEDGNFWMHKKSVDKRHNETDEGQMNDLEMLNCTSAGLFELARKSDLYQKILSEAREAQR